MKLMYPKAPACFAYSRRRRSVGTFVRSLPDLMGRSKRPICQEEYYLVAQEREGRRHGAARAERGDLPCIGEDPMAVAMSFIKPVNLIDKRGR